MDMEDEDEVVVVAFSCFAIEKLLVLAKALELESRSWRTAPF